tara:strand:- start:527 stop:1816 length:1290 start_codon:yes stop_codon:yes gene_type:complete
MTTKLDQIYLDNLAVDEDDVIDIEALQEKARAEMQPSLFDLGAVNSLGYDPAGAIDTLMTKEDKKFAGQLAQSVGKGSLKLTGGFVGDLLGIAKGLYNIPQDQMDQLMVRIEDPTVQQKLISGFDSFMRGFDEIEELNLPPLLGRTSEAIGEDLTEMGFDPKSEADSEFKKKALGAAELVGEIGTPVVGVAPVIKGAKAVKNLNPKSVKILDNGVEQIFKRSGKNVFGNKQTYVTYQKNKVFTDKEGKPLTFYHGTNNPKLKTSKLDIPNQRRELMYFTPIDNLARSYSGGGTSHPDIFNDSVKVTKKMEKDYIKTLRPRIIKANLKMEKPFIVKGSNKDDFDGTNFTVNMNETLTVISNNIRRKLGDYKNTLWEDTTRSSNYKVHPRTVKLLKDKGYDGIIFPMIDIYLPFFDEAVQIKKVIKGKIDE